MFRPMFQRIILTVALTGCTNVIARTVVADDNLGNLEWVKINMG